MTKKPSSPPPTPSSPVNGAAGPAKPRKRLDRGEVIDAVAKTRQLMSSHDNATLYLNADWSWLDPEIEQKAQGLRHLVTKTSNALFDFASSIEKTSYYRDATHEDSK